MYDVIIIGKGPAGISASLYTIRANLKTLIIGMNESALAKTEKIENYYGFSEPISGQYLLKQGVEQALRLGGEIVEDEVIEIKKDENFLVTTAKRQFSAKAVLMATGQKQKKINIKNLKEFEGNGVSYCSTCDGFFYNDLKVGVLGYKDYAVHEALELLAYTKDITIFTNGFAPEFSKEFQNEAKKFNMNKKPVVSIEGKDFLQRIVFNDGDQKNIDGLFVAYESASSIDFARKLGVLTQDGSILVNSDMQTNIDGLFAAGDCTGGFKQIATAVGQGALAGRKIIEFVRNTAS
ncbi:NAD(P)/FAD-dependent oxidoreductase [Pseudobacteroides cellulosolvens]|uniref:Thioredoxin-disulfide reductase n=1 Tax=Pseudobacteroides cellulosolvens ATCC 35603 = DSM 2933 TaxID=398512 RepID=A0A0L6JMX0_9FIRM|nr:NAD(P)/FAD-dependent oxidoreductase [Pseudobacteroides cellulosolvens]KNY27114.1 Thioredoxin-disulfide reductase [Pseudobacteroides cellulosolvens ATCC 35603 = DSM 2933]